MRVHGLDGRADSSRCKHDLKNSVNPLWGILSAVIRGLDNRHAESMNNYIKTLKSRARISGTRSGSAMLLIHLGGLRLYPEAIRTRMTHYDWGSPNVEKRIAPALLAGPMPSQ